MRARVAAALAWLLLPTNFGLILWSGERSVPMGSTDSSFLWIGLLTVVTLAGELVALAITWRGRAGAPWSLGAAVIAGLLALPVLAFDVMAFVVSMITAGKC